MKGAGDENLTCVLPDVIPCIPKMAIAVLFKDGGVSATNPAWVEKLAGTLSNLDDTPKVLSFNIQASAHFTAYDFAQRGSQHRSCRKAAVALTISKLWKALKHGNIRFL